MSDLHRSRWWRWTAFLLTVMSVGVVSGVAVGAAGYFLALSSSSPHALASVRSGEAAAVASGAAVPAADVTAVHGALHRVGSTCSAGLGDRSNAVATDLDVMLDFARRHSQARFVIDDEGGSTDALLLVLRQELQTCAPSSLARINALLPERYR